MIEESAKTLLPSFAAIPTPISYISEFFRVTTEPSPAEIALSQTS